MKIDQSISAWTVKNFFSTLSGLDEPKLSISQSAFAFQITCSSLGYPKPTYHWYINDTKVIETNSSSLWLPNAVLKDGHSGIKCASQNQFGIKMVAAEEILSYKGETIINSDS